MSDQIDQKSVGRRIREAREKRGFSRVFFAKKIKISRNYLSELEGGKAVASPIVQLGIINVLGLREEWLLYGKGSLTDDRWLLLEERAKELGEDIYSRLNTMKASHALRTQAVNSIMEGKAHYGSYDELADPELYNIMKKLAEACEDPQKREALKKLLTILVPDLE